MKNKKTERWIIAQDSEKKFWDNLPNKKALFEKYGGMYSSMSKEVFSEIEKVMNIQNKTKILDVGSGPVGITYYLKKGKKYALEPLADYFKKMYNIDYKKEKVEFKKGVGEDIPYPEKFFDIITIYNVLDHVKNPNAVIKELKRVLKKEGIVYIECHFYRKRFIILAMIYSFFNKIILNKTFNPNHPHMFTLKEFKALINNYFSIEKEEEIGRVSQKGIRNLSDIRKHLLKEKKLRRKIPAYFWFLGPINYTCICKNKKS